MGKIFCVLLFTVLCIHCATGQTTIETSIEADTNVNSPQTPFTPVGSSSPITHYDDISTFGPSTSNVGDKSSFALQALETENIPSSAGQIEGRIGDGMIWLTWTSASGNIATYRIYRRDYGPIPHYGLRATVGASTSTFEDTGLDNSLPYFYKVVPVLADGKEANVIGEMTLCPMRVPVWEYVSPEPVIAAADTGVTGANSVGRPGSFGYNCGVWYAVSKDGQTVIGHAEKGSFDRDLLENPVRGVLFDRGGAGQWDSEAISDPDGWGEFGIAYSGFDGVTWRIGWASPNSNRSVVTNRRMILDVTPGDWDSEGVRDPMRANEGAVNELYYSGFNGSKWQIGRATWSGSAWIKDTHNPVLAPGKSDEWDSAGVYGACVIVDRWDPKLYLMYYTGSDGAKSQIGYATSYDGVHWAKHLANPVLPAGPRGSWCAGGVGHPTGQDFYGQTFLWFEGTDGKTTAVGRAIIHRSRIVGRHTVIYGPEWYEKTVEHFNVPTIYDALYDLLIELNGFPSQGPDYQGISCYSRGGEQNGNPIQIGQADIFDYPSFPRIGYGFPVLFAHEAGHNFGYYGILGTMMDLNHLEYHGMAGVWECYTLNNLVTNRERWGLTTDQVSQVVNDACCRNCLSEHNTTNLEAWVKNGGTIGNFVQGCPECQSECDGWSPPPQHYGYFQILAAEYGWGVWESFFRACRSGIIPTSIVQAIDTSAKKNTLLICMLSVACKTDLRERFRENWGYVNEIDDSFYESNYASIAKAMSGEQTPPAQPSNLRARVQPGPCVKLTWTPSTSLDRNHYNVYYDNGSGMIDYSSPFGVAVAPWDSFWTSPVLQSRSSQWYKFGIHAVDHWGNEEKNTNVVVSLFVPQSPAPFIRDWLVLGPFSNTNTTTLKTTDYTVTGEALLDPLPGQVEGAYRWRRAWTPRELEAYRPSIDADVMDLGRLFSTPFGSPSLCATYAFTRVFAPAETRCYLRVSHDDDCRIWLNGTLIRSAGNTPSESVIPVNLRAGWNRLCLKVCKYWGGYSFTARFCDAEGGEVPGVTWSVDAPGSTPVASVSRTELAFNDVRVGQDASLSFNILNRGTRTLAVSNLEVQGESASEFHCSAQRLDLAAGAGGKLVISFAPTTLGPKSAELVADTTDPNLPTFAIQLSGIGRNNTLYVNDDSTSGDVFTTAIGNDQNSGLDPASPLRHLSTVIERFALQDDDVIYVDSGLYVESVSVFSTDHQFTIRGAGRDLTIIDGGGAGPCMSLDNVTDVHIEQLTLQHGKGSEGPWLSNKTFGGAILAAWTDVLLLDAVLKDSTADYGGGGCFIGGNVELRKVLVSGNNAGDKGAGLYFSNDLLRAGSQHLVTNCDLIGNEAKVLGGGLFGYFVEVINSRIESNHAWAGGGAYLEARAIMNGCTVALNQADLGGGLSIADGAKAIDCNITGNVASREGGGVRMWLAPTILENCRVTGNRSEFNGGGIYAFWGTKVIGCEIKGNHAIQGVGGGAALCTPPGGTSIQNSLVLANTAVSGGGLYLDDTTVQNCTIVGNSGSLNGGGIYCVNSGTVSNTIMFSNRISNGLNNYETSEGWHYSYCCIAPLIPNGSGNINVDPRFADLGHWDPNGTPTTLADDFWVDGDYHLKSQAGRWNLNIQSWVIDTVTSPCIDAGDPASPVGDEPTPNSGRINMGAYGGTAEASKSPTN